MTPLRSSYATEADLIRAAKIGDKTAYALLYDSYAKEIFRFINGKLDQKQDAEDLTDEVFLRAWKSLKHYKDEGKPFSAYLYRIARNMVISHFRKNTKWQSVPIDTSALMIAIDKGPAEMYAEDVLQQELQQAISKLKADHKEIVTLRYIQGLSISEIAEHTGRSESTVRVTSHRALKALRTILNDANLT